MSNSKLSASNSVVRRNMSSGKKGTAARNRRALRRWVKKNGHVSCELRMELFNSELARERSLRGAWKAQTAKYSLEMFQWIFSDLLELASYWEEDQAMMSRISGYDKVAYYSYQILVSLEAKKSSGLKKAWDFLNKEVKIDTNVGIVVGLGVETLALGGFLIGMGIHLASIKPAEVQPTSPQPQHSLVQQFIKTIEEETKHLR
jgi:hypothetical protein